jgi:hypothetical protein
MVGRRRCLSVVAALRELQARLMTVPSWSRTRSVGLQRGACWPVGQPGHQSPWVARWSAMAVVARVCHVVP